MRRRVLLGVAVTVVLVPTVAVAVGWWYLASGRLARQVERLYARSLPGRLTIGSLSLHPTRLILQDVTLGDAGAAPLAHLAEVEITVAYRRLRPHLTNLTAHGVHLHLDPAAWDLLNRIIDAASAGPPSTDTTEIPLAVDGDVDLGGAATLGSITVAGKIRGPDTSVEAQTVVDGTPLTLQIHLHPDGARRLMDIRSSDAAPEDLRLVRLLPLLDGAAAIGLMAPVPTVLRRYLPAEVDPRGTTLTHDLSADRWSGSIVAHWPGGAGSGTLLADQHQIRVQHLDLEDPTRLRAEGTLVADIDGDRLQVDAAHWQPGPMLPVPAVVPLPAILAIMPQIHLDYGWHDGHQHVLARATAPSPSEAHLAVTWASDAPILIEGGTLPLTLGQSFLPAAVVIDDGLASSVAIRIVHGDLARVDLVASQARCTAFGWSVGEIDGSGAIVPTPAGDLGVTALITHAGPGGRGTPVRVGDIGFSGHPGGGMLHVHLARVEDLLIRLHGPTGLPDLRGALDLDLDLTQDQHGLTGRIDHLGIASIALPDLLQNGGALVRGEVVWAKQHLQVNVHGQLQHGQVRLPGAWLDVAAHTPIFTASVTYSPPDRYAPAAIDITRILVRSADHHGDPLPGGYSADLAGNLTASGTGQIQGVVDHLDLAWVNSVLSLGALTMSGEGAIAITADLSDARMTQLEGSFLPLNADLLIGADFKATGITGQVQFNMARTGGDSP